MDFFSQQGYRIEYNFCEAIVLVQGMQFIRKHGYKYGKWGKMVTRKSGTHKGLNRNQSLIASKSATPVEVSFRTTWCPFSWSWTKIQEIEVGDSGGDGRPVVVPAAYNNQVGQQINDNIMC